MKKHTSGSLVRKRSVVINGHKTSMGLEDAFWSAFKDIAANKNITLQALVTQIDNDRKHEK